MSPPSGKKKETENNQGKKKTTKIHDTVFPLLMPFCTSVVYFLFFFCSLILFKKLPASSRWPL